MALAGRILKLLVGSFNDLYIDTPRKHKCTIVKVKTKDEASAARLLFALGITQRDNRQELSAAIGSRTVWASVERPPQAGQRRRSLRQAMEWAQLQVPAPDL